MRISRRSYLQWSFGLAAMSLYPSLASATTSQTSPSFSHYMLGSARITAITDGIGRRPLTEGFVKNASLAEVQTVLSEADLPTTYIDIPYTCYVVDAAGKRYLLDTGFADNGPAGTGLLQQHMRAAGIDPASIDAVIISHLHGDHINGLRQKDGRLVYPNATIYVPRPEMEFWLDPQKLSEAPESTRGGFLNARRVFDNYPADKLHLFAPGTDIAPHIRTISAPGHTPGHTVIEVHSDNERFTFLGDTTNIPALFVTRPNWVVQFDMNPEQATATRQALLQQLAQQGSIVGGYHFPQPAFGRIRQVTPDSYRWEPEI